MKKFNRISSVLVASIICASIPFSLAACANEEEKDTIVLRVANWEEYIDLGDWAEDELIDIDNPFSQNKGVIGINSVYDDYIEWFNNVYAPSKGLDFSVSIEYSTFGTNEDLYNRLTLGDVYDLVCPSEYMIMKLIAEDKLVKLSDSFMDKSNEYNYYINNVSPYILESLDNLIYSDEVVSNYAACYMWGTTGLVYNPDYVNTEDVSSWDILLNEDYYKKVTVKDNVRDTYFATLGILNKQDLASDNLTPAERSNIYNNTDDDTISAAQDILKNIKENVYSFETDSGKADMVTGKVLVNLQWSGDAVYIMEQVDAEGGETDLWYSITEEGPNIYLDGWVMLKDGIQGNKNKQLAAEAFINYLSRPDIAVRNMYYIGYTSAIASDMTFDYWDWCFGVCLDPSDKEYFDNQLKEIYAYDISYFFGRNDGEYIIYGDISDFEVIGATTSTLYVTDEYPDNNIEYTLYSGGSIKRGRQLFAQCPTSEVLEKGVIMLDFGKDLSKLNQMWIEVRCLDLLDVSPVIYISVASCILLLITVCIIYKFRYNIFVYKPKKGYIVKK